MLKRFVVGFALGVGLMYYYLYHGHEVAGRAADWGNTAASNYRGDRDRQMADDLSDE